MTGGYLCSRILPGGLLGRQLGNGSNELNCLCSVPSAERLACPRHPSPPGVQGQGSWNYLGSCLGQLCPGFFCKPPPPRPHIQRMLYRTLISSDATLSCTSHLPETGLNRILSNMGIPETGLNWNISNVGIPELDSLKCGYPGWNKHNSHCQPGLDSTELSHAQVSWWTNKHNSHHAVPNLVESCANAADGDPDIDTMPFLAWSKQMFMQVCDVVVWGHLHLE